MLWGNKFKKTKNTNKVGYAGSSHINLDEDNARYYVGVLDKIMKDQDDTLDGRVAYALIKTMMFGRCDIKDLGITRLAELDDSVRILHQLNNDNAGLAFTTANTLLYSCGPVIIEKYIIASSVVMTAITEYLTSVEGKSIIKKQVLGGNDISIDEVLDNIYSKLNVSNSLTRRLIRMFVFVSLDSNDDKIICSKTLQPSNMCLTEVLAIIGEVNKHKYLLKDVGILLRAGEFRVTYDVNESIARMNQVLSNYFLFNQSPYGLGTQIFSNLNISGMIRGTIHYTDLEVGLKFIWSKMNESDMFWALENAESSGIFNIKKIFELDMSLFRDIIYVLFLAMDNKFIHLDSIIVDLEERYPGHKANILNVVNKLSKDKVELIKGQKKAYGVEAERRELLIGSLFVNLNMNENIEKIWNSKDGSTMFIEDKREILDDYLINGLDERFNRRQISNNTSIQLNMLNSRKDVINYILVELPKMLDNSTKFEKLKSFSNIIYDKPIEINTLLTKASGVHWINVENPSEVLKEVIILFMIGMDKVDIEKRISKYSKEEVLKGYFDIVLRQSRLSLGGIFNILINNEIHVGNLMPIDDVEKFFKDLATKICKLHSNCDHDGDKMNII